MENVEKNPGLEYTYTAGGVEGGILGGKRCVMDKCHVTWKSWKSFFGNSMLPSLNSEIQAGLVLTFAISRGDG